MATDPHPVTEQAAAERWNKDARLMRWDDWRPAGRAAILDAFRDMHDAGREHERANPAGRPWETLTKDDQLNEGDVARWDYAGRTTTSVVARVDEDGNPWNAQEAIIGLRDVGTWHRRRPAPQLPPRRSGVVLIPADGCEYITATVGGQKYRAREAMRADGRWRAVWRKPDGTRVCYSVQTADLTPDTWKVEEK